MEAAKAVERAQRDAVKAAVPEARGLLRTEAGALKAEEVLARMAQRAANRDVVSLPAHVIAAGELAKGGVPFWAALANMLRNNQLKVGIYADALAEAIQRQDVRRPPRFSGASASALARRGGSGGGPVTAHGDALDARRAPASTRSTPVPRPTRPARISSTARPQTPIAPAATRQPLEREKRPAQGARPACRARFKMG